LNNRQTTKE